MSDTYFNDRALTWINREIDCCRKRIDRLKVALDNECRLIYFEMELRIEEDYLAGLCNRKWHLQKHR